MDWKTQEKNTLIQALLTLKTPDEMRRFLRDLMTEKEINELAGRLQTAQLLDQNVPYTEITKKTGLSSTTIARVSQWLNGTEGGYRTIINRLHHHTPIQAKRGLS